MLNSKKSQVLALGNSNGFTNTASWFFLFCMIFIAVGFFGCERDTFYPTINPQNTSDLVMELQNEGKYEGVEYYLTNVNNEASIRYDVSYIYEVDSTGSVIDSVQVVEFKVNGFGPYSLSRFAMNDSLVAATYDYDGQVHPFTITFDGNFGANAVTIGLDLDERVFLFNAASQNSGPEITNFEFGPEVGCNDPLLNWLSGTKDLALNEWWIFRRLGMMGTGVRALDPTSISSIPALNLKNTPASLTEPTAVIYTEIGGKGYVIGGGIIYDTTSTGVAQRIGYSRGWEVQDTTMDGDFVIPNITNTTAIWNVAQSFPSGNAPLLNNGNIADSVNVNLGNCNYTMWGDGSFVDLSFSRASGVTTQ